MKLLIRPARRRNGNFTSSPIRFRDYVRQRRRRGERPILLAVWRTIPRLLTAEVRP